MFEFLSDNIGTIVVLVILFTAILLAVRKIYKDKKSGVSSCGGNCSSCGGRCGISREESFGKRS